MPTAPAASVARLAVIPRSCSPSAVFFITNPKNIVSCTQALTDIARSMLANPTAIGTFGVESMMSAFIHPIAIPVPTQRLCARKNATNPISRLIIHVVDSENP